VKVLYKHTDIAVLQAAKKTDMLIQKKKGFTGKNVA
jgi:hypothetical protein